MTNDLAELFARIDADPTIAQPKDIDALIAYYRSLRAKKATGKAKRDTGPELKIDLAQLGLKAAPVAVKRRV